MLYYLSKFKCLSIFIIIIYFISFNCFAWGTNNFIKEFKSPLKNESTKKILIVGTSATILFRFVFKKSISEPFQKIAIKNKLGLYERPIELMGRVVPNGIYSLAMLGNYFLSRKKNKKSLKNMEIMLKATAYAGLFTNLLKYTIREQRPASGSHTSFPSGHATTAFAFASVVAARHPWYYGVAAYSLATLVAYQRIGSNSHYLYDVIAGATIGIVFGLSINKLLDNDKAHSKSSTIISPLKNGIMFGYVNNF